MATMPDDDGLGRIKVTWGGSQRKSVVTHMTRPIRS